MGTRGVGQADTRGSSLCNAPRSPGAKVASAGEGEGQTAPEGKAGFQMRKESEERKKKNKLLAKKNLEAKESWV